MSFQLLKDESSRIAELDNGILKLQTALDRGNIFKSLMFQGKELILIKSENYHSHERPTCGCPILFPYSGNNQNDCLEIEGKKMKTGIHGIVHSHSWELLDHDNQKAVFTTQSNKQTKSCYPFDFTLFSTISLDHNALRYELTARNDSEKVMPCDFGLHPFFLIPSLYDVAFSGKLRDGYQLGKIEMDQVCGSGVLCELIDELTIDIMNHVRLTFKNLEGFVNMLIWSGDPQRFLVIEPLTSRPNAINDHVNHFDVQPGECCCAVLEIKVEVYE